MVTVVFIGNLLISLGNLYVAWRIWKFRQAIAKVTTILTKVERRIHLVLSPAPGAIAKGEKGTHHLREHYQKLELQMQRVEQVLLLINLGYRIWQRQSRLNRS